MSSLIDFSHDRSRRLEEAWADYRAARDQAEETRAIEDGIAAGRAWRRWLDLFMSTEQREALDKAGEVVSLRRLG